MTYNVHSCVGTDGHRSVERIAEVIAASDPDVVALQEVDQNRPRSQHVHQTEAIARELTMHFHFHPALRIEEEEYGDAILSKHPLRVARAGALPMVRGIWGPVETRGALSVLVTVGRVEWQIINTHFGLGRAERLAQALALLGEEWVGQMSASAPLIVCGDFNSHAGGRVHRLLSNRLTDAQKGLRRSNTFPSRFPVLCLDHVFLGKAVRLEKVDVPRTPLTRVASDHLPLVVDVHWSKSTS